MTVRGIENSYIYKASQNGRKQEKDNPVGGFLSGMSGEEEKREERTSLKGRVDASAVYAYQKAASANPVKETENVVSTAASETVVRNLSYAESDAVVVDVLGGCTMKAKADVAGRSVYIEVKTEAGEVKAYEVDPFHVPRGTENPMEALALTCYRKAAAETASAEQEDTQTAENDNSEAGTVVDGEKDENADGSIQVPGAEKAERYAYKPQYISEMTNEEWEALLKKTDVEIESAKELSRLHKEEMEEKAEERAIDRRSRLQSRLDGTGQKYVPYSYMADENGVIEYKGVVFQCDYETGALCLGDMSKESKVLTIPLSEGGCLKVNRDNIGQLASAIGMFSPEDVNRILRAIAQDARVRQAEQELDEDSDSIGESAEEHLDEEAGVADAGKQEEEQNSGTQAATSLFTGSIAASEKQEEEKGEKISSEIVQKPDGSRVLVITTEIAGTSVTTSVRISEPDESDMQREQKEREREDSRSDQQGKAVETDS